MSCTESLLRGIPLVFKRGFTEVRGAGGRVRDNLSSGTVRRDKRR
jgi:hypothetical protein